MGHKMRAKSEQLSICRNPAGENGIKQQKEYYQKLVCIKAKLKLHGFQILTAA